MKTVTATRIRSLAYPLSISEAMGAGKPAREEYWGKGRPLVQEAGKRHNCATPESTWLSKAEAVVDAMTQFRAARPDLDFSGDHDWDFRAQCLVEDGTCVVRMMTCICVWDEQVPDVMDLGLNE